tara:strand:- start:213 stop:452 length:240 start_codon:yes stop_codon:yes gene_type:complete
MYDDEMMRCSCCMNLYGGDNNNFSGKLNLCYDCDVAIKEERNDFLDELMDAVMDYWIDYNYKSGKKGYENRKEFIYDEA